MTCDYNICDHLVTDVMYPSYIMLYYTLLSKSKLRK